MSEINKAKAVKGRTPRSRWLGLASGVVFLAGVAVLDYLSGDRIVLSIFYVVPAFMLTWYVGVWAGLLALAFCAVDLFAPFWVPWLGPGTSEWPWNSGLEMVLLALVVWLAARLRRTLEKESADARTDHLTGTLNARAFEETVHREMRRADRSGKPMTVAFADVDDFKAVNDTYGHQTGDEVLRVLAETMRQSVRGADALARLGGDEFALLLPECGSDAAPQVLARLHDRLLEAVQRRGWTVSLSVGAATFEAPPASYSEIIQRVDALMYEAKRAGKNGFRHQVAPRDGGRTLGGRARRAGG